MRHYLVFAAAALSLSAADRTLTSDSPPAAIYFSADGKSISGRCRDNRIRTWDVASGALRADKAVSSGTALLSGELYAERDAKTKTMRVWDLSAERQLQMINGAPAGRTAVSNDRRLIATASPEERAVRIWNVTTGEQRHSLPDGLGGAAELVFSPDGETVVSANYDNDVRVWKTKSGELVRRIEDMTGAMFAAEFTPDGQHLILAGLDETVYIWDARTFALHRKLQGQGETIAALAISPDGRTLVTGGFDVLTTRNPVKVAIWDLATGKITRTLRSPHRVVSLAFSPDGKWIAMASGEKEVSLWKVEGAPQ
jgi:WD40 repeat protein